MDAQNWSPDPEYAKYPDHDLHDVPLVVLEAARAYMRLAATYNDVDKDLAEPIADSVIAKAMPLIREWLSSDGRPRPAATTRPNDSIPSV
jgi:hypothetical protein